MGEHGAWGPEDAAQVLVGMVQAQGWGLPLDFGIYVRVVARDLARQGRERAIRALVRLAAGRGVPSRAEVLWACADGTDQ